MPNLSFEDVLHGTMDYFDPALSTGLWWCKSVYDVEAVGYNAVCLSSAGKWEDVKYCLGWLEQFAYIFVASPDGDLAAKIRQHVPSMPILAPGQKAFGEYTSVAAVKAALGSDGVHRLLMGAVEVPAEGLLNLAQVDTVDDETVPRTLSGFEQLDRLIGGFRAGEMSLWTGKRGEGKSTILGQILVEGVDQGHKVCAYSGELPAGVFKAWAALQAAGPKAIRSYQDKQTGGTEWRVTDQAAKLIDQWWDHRFYLCDIGLEAAHDEDFILSRFEYAHRVCGCDIFLVDNVMTARLSGDRDYYRAQSAFARRLVRFAKANASHVHLVAHPRKTDGKAIDDSDDVGGTGDLPNLADNVFSVTRLSGVEPGHKGCDAAVLVLKNRRRGMKKTFGLKFHAPSRRYYSRDKSPDKPYGWEISGKQVELSEVHGDDPDNPF